MSQPDKCDCQKLVIALLDRADALHRDEIEMLECGHAKTYSQVHALQAEVERLRKAGDDCEKALCRIVSDAFFLERMPATWAVGIDVAINRWLEAKEVQS